MDTNTHQKSVGGTERRSNDMLALQLMSETRARVEHQEKIMAEKLERLTNDLEAQMSKSDQQYTELRERIERLSDSVLSYMQKTPDQIVGRIEDLLDDAFPDDPDIPDATPSEKRKMHRKYHAKLIQHALEAQARNKSILEKLMTWAAQNAIALILMALWAYFQMKVH